MGARSRIVPDARHSRARTSAAIKDGSEPSTPGNGRESKSGKPSARAPRARQFGTGAVPGNEGVGEHVRTRFHLRTSRPGEIAKLRRDPHRTKKTRFFCRTGFWRSELLRNTIQPFDL